MGKYPKDRRDAVRRRGLRIIRFRINAKAHSLRRSSSPHPTRCRWAWTGTRIYSITLRLGLQCPLSPDPFYGRLEMLLRLLTKISELIGWFLP